MKTSRIGQIAGIDVFVHWSFTLLVGWVGLSSLMKGTSVLLNVGMLLAVFGCVVLHEVGHALAARQFGVGTKSIVLLPIGGVANLERIPREPLQELWIAVAGPLVNVAIATVVYLLTAFLVQSGVVGATGGYMLSKLLMINVGLVVFNMLPAFPMDGGRIFRSTLAMFLPYVRATNMAAAVGKVMAVLLGVIGLFGNPMLILLAAFVFIAGGAEARAVEMEMQSPEKPKWVWPTKTREKSRVVIDAPPGSYRVVRPTTT